MCWLANLGDLKQEDPFVAQQLIAWMAGLQSTCAFDGVRIDTVPYVNQSFWREFQEHGLGGAATYSVGEVLVSDTQLVYEASSAVGESSVIILLHPPVSLWQVYQ